MSAASMSWGSTVGNKWQVDIDRIILHPIATRLVSAFETSFGAQQLRAAVLIELHTRQGAVGWGEVTANWDPGYSYETVHTALHILNDFLIPRLLKVGTVRSDSKWDWLDGVRGHPLAKHGLLSAILTAAAAEKGIPLAELLRQISGSASHRAQIEAGVSIGIQPTIRATLEKIEQYLADGYKRVKLKIKPGWDVIVLRGVRAVYPDLMLMADANSAYTLKDVDLLRQMDEFHLLMIEQPLGYEDIYQHSLLQKQIETPICLDESLHSLGHVQLAWQLGACKVVNLKPQRVGGLLEAIQIHNFCYENEIPLWIGGMLETGVGRAASVALASLPGITLPADLSATNRYYNPDLAEPPFMLDKSNSTIPVPTEPGLGVEVDQERVLQAEQAFSNEELRMKN